VKQLMQLAADECPVLCMSVGVFYHDGGRSPLIPGRSRNGGGECYSETLWTVDQEWVYEEESCKWNEIFPCDVEVSGTRV